MRNVVLAPALLLALSVANASAEDLGKPGSTRFALEAYDKELTPEDRKHIENFIGGSSWDSCGQT